MIENILLKLSVKSLLRFKSVSKSWNTIVSDPLFARNHYHQNSEPRNLFLRRRTYADDYGLAFFKLENGKLQTIKVIETPLAPPQYGDRLCFSEYGVILITNNWNSERCLLWNRSTRTARNLSFPYGLNMRCSGICYDPAIDDFKVVAVYRDFYAIYSCKNESWSNRKHHSHGIPQYQRPCRSSGVSVNGATYWLLRIQNPYAEIIYYDPRDGDKLNILQKPKDLPGDLSRSYLLDLGGHLCLYCYYWHGMGKIQIWRKGKGIDENYWKELITIHNVDIPIRLLDPLCVVGDKIVMQNEGHDGDKLVVYDPL